MSKVSILLDHHVNKEKIVYIITDDEDEVIYMIKSINRDSQVYNVVFEKHVNNWVCDCPAFKYRIRFNKNKCKHIDFIEFLLKEQIKIESI